MLRDYQIDICSRVREAFEHHRSVMVQMPTGTGKTMVLASILKEECFWKDESGRKKRSSGAEGKADEERRLSMGCVLIVAHRRELIEQIKATVSRMGWNDGGKGVKGETEKGVKGRPVIVVESVQTIARRIDSLGFTPFWVVIDEAHHALAKTYRMMWEAWPEAKFLGLTATPCRLNGKGFTDLFEVLVQSWDIPTFIREKWLSTYDFVSIKADSRTQQLIGSLKKRGTDGDYQVKEMDAVLNKRPSIERLYQSFMEYAPNRKGFVYAINIDHARSIADYYRSQGVRAVVIDSRTPARERERLIASFRSGDLQVLVNVDIFSEGFDCPDVEFIQLARPTLSLAKYLQMVGRGLRPSKGKKNCMVMDNVGLYRVFGLPSQIWDWEGMFKGIIKGGNGGKGEEGKSGNSQLSLFNPQPSFVLHQRTDSEMYLVVSHEQLDATFEQQKKEDVMAKKRKKLLNGGYGKVRMVGKQLVELMDTRSTLPSYVDLYNMNWFCHAAEGKPALVRLGDVDFLKYGLTLISRTRTPIHLSYYKECIRKFGFYSTHSDSSQENMGCMHFYRSGYRYGSKDVVFLHDEPLEYYWMSCELQDGGLVVMSIEGCYYHAQKGRPKVYLGCADTEENKTRLMQAVHTLIKEAELRYREKQEGYRRDVESLAYVRPYQVGVKWGLHGSDGRVLAPPIYRTVKEQNGYFLVEDLPLHWGVMDKFGKILIAPKHDKVVVTPDGKAIVSTITGKQTVVDLSKAP